MNDVFTLESLTAFLTEARDSGRKIQVQENISKEWLDAVGSPIIGAYLGKWRLAPKKKKVIDWQTVIDNQLDCVFKNTKGTTPGFIGKLAEVHINERLYPFTATSRATFKCCEIRQEPVFWQGGECPLPEGLEVKIFFRNINEISCTDYTILSWKLENMMSDIIGYQVLGLADGYCWGWEGE